MTGKAPRILIVALAVQIAIGAALVFAASRDFDFNGDDGGEPAAAQVATTARPDRFDAARAYALTREQVERFGPRPAGSEASRRLARRLRELLPNGRLDPVPGGLRNVVGALPGRGKAIVVGAHFDTHETPEGYLGANDSATGTAAVVEIARALRRAGRPKGAPPVRFVLFDGEEAPKGCEPFEDCGLRGSKAYAAEHAGRTRAMILLDYIAGKGARLPREGTSDEALWARLRAAARRVGAARTFPAGTGAAILDDHTPFLEAGVPAIDLIDWDYRSIAHTPRDTLDQVSRASLDAVGETVTQLVLDLSRPGGDEPR